MHAIVVIDSEPIVRSVITKILEAAGYSVTSTGEFDDALAIVRWKVPDLVVTSVFLRGIAGHEAVLILKDNFPGIRVLMVSGLPDEEAVSIRTGGTGINVFPEPFAAADLVQKVHQILAA